MSNSHFEDPAELLIADAGEDEDPRLPKDLVSGGAAVDVYTIEGASKSGHISLSMFNAITNFDVDVHANDPRFGCVHYFRIQNNQEIGNVRLEVPVHIDRSEADHQVHQSWYAPLIDGMQAINGAAPGLHLYEVSDTSDAKVFVRGNKNEGCWTKGNIVRRKRVAISLDQYWSESQKRGSAVHEMMHALGFQHEHKRGDGEKYLKYNISGLDDKWKGQYAVSKFVTGLNRFDPHSIMMYRLSEELERMPDGDTVWKTKTGDERFQVLSELDKVGLNILYRPVPHSDGYKPKFSSITGLMYCGRRNFVEAEKDVLKRAFSNGVCGPNTGANCAACRVQKTKKSEVIDDDGKWQGWTGLVYCGTTFGPVDSNHDGYCGPNNGPPCKECGLALIPGYDPSQWVARYS